MEMRTFEAFTMRDALKAVKSHFGQDAVILNTREKRLEGSKGKIYEVTAAANQEKAAKSGATRSTSGGDASGIKDNLIEMVEYFRGLERSIKSLGEELAKKQDLFRLDSGLHELRTLIFDEYTKRKGSFHEQMPPAMGKVFQRLQLMGVDEAEMSRLAEYLKGLKAPEGDNSELHYEYYQAQAIRWMMKRLKIAASWTPEAGERAIHVVVGSSGSGKTSSVAKIAAHYQQKYGSRLLLLSFDNRRLAAREQLRILSRVLDIRYESIDEVSQIASLGERKEDWDLCLIDTTAECPRVKDDLGDLLSIKEMDLPIRFHLSLSIAEKESQMDRMIRGFSPLGIQSLIFNRLDESWSYGEIFNLCLRWGLPLSYFGVGKAIPEDLEKASRERVVERIFGL